MNYLVLCVLLACILNTCSALNCFKCDSPDCKEESISCDATVTSCFTKVDTDNTITRGCNDLGTCEKPSCSKCDSDDCNNKQLICRECFAHADCAQTNITTNSYNRVCDVGDSCFVEINANKTTTRGCASDKTKSDICFPCETNFCNGNIFPENRLQCYSCDKCANTASELNKTCEFYESEDSCYTYGADADTMHRGCLSDTEAKCSTQSDECAICNTTGCNNVEFNQSGGTCIICGDGDGDASACAAEQKKDNATKCNEIKFTQQPGCYTQLKGSQVYRGCYNDRKEDLGNCTKENHCEYCETLACNVNSVEVEFTCIVCRSDINSACRDPVDKIKGQQCTNGNQTQCLYGEWNGIVIRGCFEDADLLTQYQCLNSADSRCSVCSGINCNTNAFSAGVIVEHLHMRSLGLLAVLCLIVGQSNYF